MNRREVNDKQREVIPPIFPKRTAKSGRSPSNPRLMLIGILWILQPGSPRRALPKPFSPWQTEYDDFSISRVDGVCDLILKALHIRSDAEGAIDWDLRHIDGLFIRTSRAAAAQVIKAIGG